MKEASAHIREALKKGHTWLDKIYIQDEIYDHTAAFIRAFGFGKACSGETDKIIRAFKPVWCYVSSMIVEAKDNKVGWTPALGQLKRPLCNGKTGANAGIGLLTSSVMRPIRDDINAPQLTSICSREELLRDITDLI